MVSDLFLKSPTLGAGFRRYLHYYRLLSDHVTMRLEENPLGPEVMIAGRLGEEHTPSHTEITVLFGILQLVRLATASRFRPLRLELCCAPGGNPEEFAAVFGCPVSFNAAETRCYFERGMLELPLLHSDPEMVEMLEAMAQRRMRRVLRQDVVDDVRREVASRLEDEAFTLKAIAAQLRRSPRRLRSELLDAGTSFNEIIAEARQSMAKRLLGGSSLPLEQVGQRVGFSERTAFFRAFKRWTGLTPQQYRHSRQQGAVESPGED